MLLEGSFRKDVERVMEALKVTRRRAIYEKKLKVAKYVHISICIITITTMRTFRVSLESKSHHVLFLLLCGVLCKGP